MTTPTDRLAIYVFGAIIFVWLMLAFSTAVVMLYTVFGGRPAPDLTQVKDILSIIGGPAGTILGLLIAKYKGGSTNEK